MKHLRYVSANAAVFVAAAVIAASCAAGPAAAAPSPYCDKSSFIYDADLCAQIGDRTGSGPTLVPATTAPSTSSSSGGLSGFVSDHAGLIVLVVAALIAWAVIAGFRDAAADKEKAAAARAQGALARGRRIAEDWHANRVAQERATLPQPDPADYDPLGLGLMPPTQKDPEVEWPPMDTEDLRRYAEYDAVVPWQANTAIAAVMGRDGSDGKARDAWLEACKAANAGDTDASGIFTPCASYRGLDVPVDAPQTGDVRIRVMPVGLHVGEREMNAAGAYLARCAMVTIAHPFVRHAHTGEYWARLSMHATQQPSAPAPQAAPAAAGPIDDDEDW